MRPHHTKDKGDVGLAHAIADLADQGFVVLTTHQSRNVLLAERFRAVPATA